MKSYLLIGQKNFGIYYARASETTLPENKVCIEILSRCLKISFKSQHVETSMKIDLMEA